MHGSLAMTSEVAHAAHLLLEWCATLLIMSALTLRLIRRRQGVRASPVTVEDPVPADHGKTQEALLREVNHRVKNNFSSIIGLIRLKREVARTPIEAAHLNDMETKLTGLANLHSMVSLSRWRPVGLEALCRSLVSSAAALAGLPIQLTLQAGRPSLEIGHAQAHQVTLIINELVTNAIKHAPQPGIMLTIALTLQESGEMVILDFSDNGPGYPLALLAGSAAPTASGLRIIHDLTVSGLGGSITFSNNPGAGARIRFPRQK